MIGGTSRRSSDDLILNDQNDISDIILSIEVKLGLISNTALGFKQERCLNGFVLKHFLAWLGPH